MKSEKHFGSLSPQEWCWLCYLLGKVVFPFSYIAVLPPSHSSVSEILFEQSQTKLCASGILTQPI